VGAVTAPALTCGGDVVVGDAVAGLTATPHVRTALVVADCPDAHVANACTVALVPCS
jgi:hypothetical protein